ncbi:MAG: MBL fold metallo-hydrolase [Pseudorhodoplanes sp.]|uniref:MBL fold metallo-hydrolase n=1 Tax=Pseudorhodoplanes sp. TaxID=1934341 RepID=UPI003D0B226B
MSKLTRRAILSAAAAVSAGSIASGGMPSVHAAAAPQGKQNTGWYRYKIGDIEVTVVTDGIARFKMAENYVANVKPEVVDAALATIFMDRNQMVTPYNPTVVNSGGKVYVIDPGLGQAANVSTKGLGGQLLGNMGAAGIDPKSVDGVIITHLHPDHINGLLLADGSLAFPNAEVLIPALERSYWLDDGEMSRAPKGLIEAVFKNVRRVFAGEVLKRTAAYEPGKEVVPGVTSVATNGHTIGHNSLIIASGSDKMFLQGDVAHFPMLFVRNPGWHVWFDQDAAMAEATRRKVYDMLVAEKMLMQGFHFPFPAVARIEKSGDGYREVPVLWNPTI